VAIRKKLKSHISKSRLNELPRFNITTAVVLASFAIAFGVVIVFHSRAAGVTISVEPETGSLSGTASVGSDAQASNAQYIKFGAGMTGGGTTILADEFNGTSIDTTKWDVYNRISDQVNQEVNCVIPANVSVSGGILNGFSKHEDHTCGDSLPSQPQVLEHYTSWQIAQKAAAFQYGTVEVRAKLPGGTGIWPTIFLLGNLWQPSQAATANVSGSNWPIGGWSEVDIAEFWQNTRNQVNNVVHFNTASNLVLDPLPFNATSRFMVYRLQWSASALTWSVDAEDGVGFRTLRTITDPAQIPNTPMYLTINAAIGGNGGGIPDPNTFPQTYQIDWIHITQ
jgi:beta-glucanase (GH16 family)